MQLIGSCIIFILTLLLLVGAWRFGDWKNWRDYYPTILFAIGVDFFIGILTYSYPLWRFHPTFFAPTHTLADFLIAFTNFPPIVFVYLSRFPYQARLRIQLCYMMAWSVIFMGFESVFLLCKRISYHHGWNAWWSILVWIFIFAALRLHHTRPLWAWILCLGCTTFLIFYFKIPILSMK